VTTPQVDLDLAARIISLATWATTDNVIAGPVRYNLAARPAIFVELYGGTRADHTDGRLRTFLLQITILGERDRYGETMTKAIEVFDAIDRSGRWQGASGAHYIDTISEGATPLPVGIEDDESPRFTFTASVMHDDG